MNNIPLIYQYKPEIEKAKLEIEKAIKDFIYEDQQIQIERRQLENAKGFVELNTFYIESNKADLVYKVSTWVLERIYCKKDGEIIPINIIYINIWRKRNDWGSIKPSIRWNNRIY